MTHKLLLNEGDGNEVQVHVKLSVSGARCLSPWVYAKSHRNHLLLNGSEVAKSIQICFLLKGYVWERND